jgi:FkbM family methyltransferase
VVERLHHVAVGARRSLRRYERFWRTIQPAWDFVIEAVTRQHGYLAHVNDDPIRITYRYGARYEKVGYELPVHRAFTVRIEPGMTVVDVGAHVGFFALAAALRARPTGKVYAFEPAPETADLLERHVHMNDFEGTVEVLRIGLSDRRGEAAFYAHGETMAAALFPENIALLSPEERGSPPREHRIGTTTLDMFCSERSISPDRIKIDVEGAELAVLKGAAKILRGDAEILCEVHPSALEFMSGSVDDVESLLATEGRELERVTTPNRLGIYHVLSSRASEPAS